MSMKRAASSTDNTSLALSRLSSTASMRFWSSSICLCRRLSFRTFFLLYHISSSLVCYLPLWLSDGYRQPYFDLLQSENWAQRYIKAFRQGACENYNSFFNTIQNSMRTKGTCEALAVVSSAQKSTFHYHQSQLSSDHFLFQNQSLYVK